MREVIAEDGNQRQHRQHLQRLLETTNGLVRIASAYVNDTDLFVGLRERRIQLLTSLLPMDIVSKATSLESLRSFIETGAQCRYLSDGPRLHAKVYIFGDEFAVVTSANLTMPGLDRNIEVGVRLSGQAVQELIGWFDSFWERATRLDATTVTKWQEQTAALQSKWQQQIAAARREYLELRKKLGARPTLPTEPLSSDNPFEALRQFFDSDTRFFWCNTNRDAGPGGNELEKRMHDRKYVAAWTRFTNPGAMKQVKVGDVIFMYANRAGIIGIGRAKKEGQKVLHVLRGNDADRIRRLDEGENEEEWRIKVDDWLIWNEEEPYYRKKMVKRPLYAFADINGKEFQSLRAAVMRHFLDGS